MADTQQVRSERLTLIEENLIKQTLILQSRVTSVLEQFDGKSKAGKRRLNAVSLATVVQALRLVNEISDRFGQVTPAKPGDGDEGEELGGLQLVG